MDDDDDALWRRMTKDIKQLDPKRKTQKPQAGKPVKKRKVKQSAAPPVLDTPQKSTPVATDLDRRTEDRLRRGKLPIEDRIDLHGMYRETAQDAVRAFILNAYKNNKRCVLIITGKGTLDKPAVLKENLPDWLDMPDIAPLVLKAYPAQPIHGGSGAFYVYLRRNRPPQV